MNFGFALIASALTGWIALSYEILWARIYSFTSQGHANSFGMLLGVYLLGLAAGSLLSGRLRRADDPTGSENLRIVARVVFASNLAGFLVIPGVATIATAMRYGWGYGLIIPAAALLGIAFPLLCHAAIPPNDRAGASTSYLYVANIVGSVAGSLTTGFVLMDSLTTVQIAQFLAYVGFGLSLLLALLASRKHLVEPVLSTAVGVTLVVLGTPALYDRLWEKLQWGRGLSAADATLAAAGEPRYTFETVNESKSGVITLGRKVVYDWKNKTATLEKHTEIYGGGVYDGQMRTVLEEGGWLVRPYSISYLHPAPKRVLMIGLSGGAWASIIAANPHVETLWAVEINPGYEEVISKYPVVAPIMKDPRFKLIIDDGRRWLVSNPDEKFDMIVANTTFHWRSFASNLLSSEFQELVAAHLAPGGIYLYNTTGSADAAFTSAQVFPYSMMVVNNVVGANAPFNLDAERWRKALEGTTLPLGSASAVAPPKAAIDWLVNTTTHINEEDPVLGGYVLRDRQGMAEFAKGGRLITDDNMLTEW